MTPTDRILLGSDHDLASRRKIFRLPDALEIDELSFLQIQRTRVYFDDVLAITYHRYRGVLFLVLNGLLAGLFAVMAAISWGVHASAGVIADLALMSPFVIALAVRCAIGVDVITVHGRRTTARLRFGLLKGRARRVYQDLVSRIRVRQEAEAASGRPAPAAPSPPADGGPEAPPQASGPAPG